MRESKLDIRRRRNKLPVVGWRTCGLTGKLVSVGWKHSEELHTWGVPGDEERRLGRPALSPAWRHRGRERGDVTVGPGWVSIVLDHRYHYDRCVISHQWCHQHLLSQVNMMLLLLLLLMMMMVLLCSYCCHCVLLRTVDRSQRSRFMHVNEVVNSTSSPVSTKMDDRSRMY